MPKLKRIKDLEEAFFLVDLLASEYGWSIEYIGNLTIPEIEGLINAMAKRKGVKLESTSGERLSQNEASSLISLAKKLKATPEQVNAIKSGQGIVL